MPPAIKGDGPSRGVGLGGKLGPSSSVPAVGTPSKFPEKPRVPCAQQFVRDDPVPKKYAAELEMGCPAALDSNRAAKIRSHQLVAMHRGWQRAAGRSGWAGVVFSNANPPGALSSKLPDVAMVSIRVSTSPRQLAHMAAAGGAAACRRACPQSKFSCAPCSHTSCVEIIAAAAAAARRCVFKILPRKDVCARLSISPRRPTSVSRTVIRTPG